MNDDHSLPDTAPAAARPPRLGRLLGYLAADPGNTTLRADALREAAGAADWATAQRLVDDGLARAPGDAALLAWSGRLHLQHGRLDDAERALSAALAPAADEAAGSLPAADDAARSRLAALAPAALLWRARCRYHTQRVDDAAADARAALALAPDAADGHGLLALLLHEQGRATEAVPHAAAALERDPDQPDALLALGCVQRDAGDADAARRVFARLLGADPDNGRGWLDSARLELGESRFDAARPPAEQAVRCLPGHVGSWHVLGWVALLLRDVDAAAHAFGQALALDRGMAETHGALAAVAALRGDETEARAAMRRARRLAPQCLSARYAELLLLQRDGRHDDARALLDAVVAGQMPGRAGAPAPPTLH